MSNQNQRRNARRVLLDKMNTTLTEVVYADTSNKRSRGWIAYEASTATVTEKPRGRARKRASSEPPASSRLLLSNLEKGVTDQDLEELLEAVGELRLVVPYHQIFTPMSTYSELFPFRLVRLHYDAKGLSAGSAEIEFVEYSDAKRAVEKYEGVTLDGRPLRFEYLIPKPTSKRMKSALRNQDMNNVLDPTGVYGKENATRALSKENHGGHYGDRGGRKASTQEKQINANVKSMGTGATWRNPKKRGASAGAGTWSDKKKPKKEVSREQLDKEMDAYMKNYVQR